MKILNLKIGFINENQKLIKYIDLENILLKMYSRNAIITSFYLVIIYFNKWLLIIILKELM